MAKQLSKKANTNSNKPIYKKWWFWIIIIVIIVAAAGAANQNKSADKSKGSSNVPVKEDCSDDEKIEIIDLSSMNANDIAKWASDNGLRLNVATAEYSSTIARGALISQNPVTGTKVCKDNMLTVVYSLGAEPTMEQKNALAKAKSYSDNMHMSKAGIYDQLTSEYGEGFSAEAAQYAVDNLVADYKANALAKAKSYQQSMHMSKSRVYDQLISEYGEQFTPEEAQYAIDNLPD